MKTKQISLRDNTINFEREIVDEASIKSLSMEHLVALVAAGAASWDWRAGAKSVNDGKVFSLADVGKDLATVKPKDGEPLPADIALAKKQLERFLKEAEGCEAPDGFTPAEVKAWYPDKADDLCREWMERQMNKYNFDFDSEDTVTADMPRFIRARRLAIVRHEAKQAKDKLADLD